MYYCPSCTLYKLHSCNAEPWAESSQSECDHLFSWGCVSLQSMLFPDILKTSPEPPCPEDYPSLKR